MSTAAQPSPKIQPPPTEVGRLKGVVRAYFVVKRNALQRKPPNCRPLSSSDLRVVFSASVRPTERGQIAEKARIELRTDVVDTYYTLSWVVCVRLVRMGPPPTTTNVAADSA